MTGRPTEFALVRDEIAIILQRAAVHASAGAMHAESGTDAMLAAEVRCAASALMSAAALVTVLAPSRQPQGGRAA